MKEKKLSYSRKSIIAEKNTQSNPLIMPEKSPLDKVLGKLDDLDEVNLQPGQRLAEKENCWRQFLM